MVDLDYLTENSPESRLESSQVSSCSYHDQSTVRKCLVMYISYEYETSAQEGPEQMEFLSKEHKSALWVYCFW